jgi:lysozyme family protein
MPIATDAQGELIAIINILTKRRGNTTDAAERAAIDTTIADLNDDLEELDQASLLDAAKVVANAADELQAVSQTAMVQPTDLFFHDIQDALHRLQNLQGQAHQIDSLPPADATPAKPIPAAQAKAAAPPAPLSSPKKTNDYITLGPEYTELFNACTIRDVNKANVEFYKSRVIKSKEIYASVGDELGIPWFFIGIIHGMECGFNFTGHLHNGDPLTARTVHAPPDRPKTGNPPFSWQESARDALIFKGYNQETDWSLSHILYLFEKYNGFGYRLVGVPSPYLWSFSNIYTKGKYTADHHFDPDAISKQCGAAVILRALKDAGVEMA